LKAKVAEARSLLDRVDLFVLDIGRQAVDALSRGAPLSPGIAGYVLRHLHQQQKRRGEAVMCAVSGGLLLS